MDDYCVENTCTNPNVTRLPRVKMPQFTRKSVKRLDVVIKKAGFHIKNELRFPQTLRPSQLEISKTKAEDILKKWGTKIRSNARRDRILVSRDGSILDGHHRWLALIFAIERGILPNNYKAPVHLYSSTGRTTLRIAKMLDTPSHSV